MIQRTVTTLCLALAVAFAAQSALAQAYPQQPEFQQQDPEARVRSRALVADVADAMRLTAQVLDRRIVLDPALQPARLVCLAPRPLPGPRLAALFSAQAEAAGLAVVEKDEVWAVTPGTDALTPGRTLLAVPLPYGVEPEGVRAYLAKQDRKSTRLNSSHYS